MGKMMNVDRSEKPCYLDDRGFEGAQVISLEDVKASSWLETIINLLWHHRPGDVVSLSITTLVVLGIESRAIGAHWVLIVVALMTVAFGVFAIMIGHIHVQRDETSSPDDSRAASQSKGEVGETQSENGPEFLRSDSPGFGPLRSRGGGSNGRQQIDHPEPERRKGSHSN